LSLSDSPFPVINFFKKLSPEGKIPEDILWLKYTKFNFGCGSALDPRWGAYDAHPDPMQA